jgi:hypothetical protein
MFMVPRILNGLFISAMMLYGLLGQDFAVARVFILIGFAFWCTPALLALLALRPGSGWGLRVTALWINGLLIVGCLISIGTALRGAPEVQSTNTAIGLSIIGALFIMNLWCLALAHGRASAPATAPRGFADAPPGESPPELQLPSDETPVPTDAVAAEEAPVGFIRRHWRGYNSLTRAFWVHGFLVGGVIVVAYRAVDALVNVWSLRTTALAGVVTVLASLIIWPWLYTGIWRSASRHVKQGGNAFIAGCAQTVALLGMALMGVALVFGAVPQAYENALIAMGRDPIARIEALRTPDGTTLILRGELGEGSTAVVRNALDAAPDVKTLVLDSVGGRLQEASWIARIVRERGLDTMVEGVCMSACTFIFLAGADRAATPNAQIGFHRASTRGLLQPENVADVMLDEYRAYGISQGFLERVAATPPESMWFPERKELIENMVINRVTLGGETTAGLATVRTRAELEETYRATPMVRALDERFPGTFDAAIDAAWSARARGASDAEVATAARTVFMAAYPKLLRTAEDTALEEFLDLSLTQIDAAYAVSADACAALIDARLDVLQVLPRELVERENLWAEKVLAAPERDPAPFDRAEFAAAAQPAYDALTPEKFEVLAALAANADKPKLQCESLRDFYRAVSALPERERLIVLRGVYQHPDEL